MDLMSNKFKSRWNTLLESVKNMNETVSQIKIDTVEINEQMAKIIKENKELKSEIAEIKKQVTDLRDKMQKLEKYNQWNNILINGIPHAENEKVREIVKLLAEGMGIEL